MMARVAMPDDAGQRLTDVWDQLLSGTDGEEKTTLGELFDALGTRSYGPLLLLPALIAASPLGAIPGMSVVTGALIFLIAGQALLGRTQPWLPRWLLGFSFSRDKLASADDTLRPWLKWVERFITNRLPALVSPPMVRVVAAVSMLLAVSFFPLALLPFAVFAPSSAILLLSVGLIARDGALILLGLGLTLLAGFLVLTLWPG